jgi:hypothetical protein
LDPELQNSKQICTSPLGFTFSVYVQGELNLWANHMLLGTHLGTLWELAENFMKTHWEQGGKTFLAWANNAPIINTP